MVGGKKKSDEGGASDHGPEVVEWNGETHKVDEIAFFYKSHRLTVLILLAIVVFVVSFARRTVAEAEINTKIGIGAIIASFLFYAAATFSDGPFTRPHPVVWRFTQGVGLCYLFLLVFLFMQTASEARSFLTYLDPALGVPIPVLNYTESCDIYTPGSATLFPNVWDKVFDVYILAHFLGWFVKALMIRDYKIMWLVSIIWELIEITFINMLPNFAECWWDQFILDIVICNGFGMYLGVEVGRYLEISQYNWTGFKAIETVQGKVRRAVLQFTPASWTEVDWELTSSIRRMGAVACLVVTLTVVDLNAFFLKHILWIPSTNLLNMWRLAIVGLVGTPALREFYDYTTNPRRKKIGNNAFLMITIVIFELGIIAKFGVGEFPVLVPMKYVLIWGAVVGGTVVWAVHSYQSNRAGRRVVAIHNLGDNTPTNTTRRRSAKSGKVSSGAALMSSDDEADTASRSQAPSRARRRQSSARQQAPAEAVETAAPVARRRSTRLRTPARK